MRRMRWAGGLLVPAVAVLVLATASTVAAAGATGAFGHHGTPSGVAGTSCPVPSLPGTTVSVSLADMGGDMMGAGSGSMRQGDWAGFRHGMMSLTASSASVPHGTVSLRASNLGLLTHELVVLPLRPGQVVGSRTPGADGKLDESGSLGEASASCAAAAGEGISSGSAGWVTLKLPAGRYELVCNLPGHYTAGMYTELDVT